MSLERQLGLPTATLAVVAGMIGTGIFFTTGIILGMAHNALLVLVLWVIGALAALTGALSYAELATMWPEAGGEYVYLKRIYGLLPSFLTGWISLLVGFSAPVAISAIAFVKYLNEFCQNVMPSAPFVPSLLSNIWGQKMIAATLILALSSIHIVGVRVGGAVQNVLTAVKLFIVTTFIGFGLFKAEWSSAERLVAAYPAAGEAQGVGIPTMGLALLIIMFSYSGWNAAAYIAGEIKNPEKNLPRALLWGTIITSILYLGLNIVFLMSAPGHRLMGQEAVGAIAAQHLFGSYASRFYTLGIALVLLSSISVEMMLGPRVSYAMAKDKMIFRCLHGVSPTFGTPSAAICLQMSLAIVYVLIGSAQAILEYTGFALAVFPLLAVTGLIVARKSYPELPRPYRVFHPGIPFFYIVLTLSMLIAGLLTMKHTSWCAVAVILAGVPVYYLWREFLLREEP
ncbi:MAG: amino acid permease [Deltaproteobacteria bacterium]|nr:amino acid permease [Deltaproteobacteria bacterium]